MSRHVAVSCVMAVLLVVGSSIPTAALTTGAGMQGMVVLSLPGDVLKGNNFTFTITPTQVPNATVFITLTSLSTSRVKILTPNVTLAAYNTSHATVHATALSAGTPSIALAFVSADPSFDDADVPDVSITIILSHQLDTLSAVIGWIYFVAWSVSFYPQVWVNYKRKSVIGLSFDYMAFNITGFLCYSIFNVGLFWVPAIQQEYFLNHPDGVIPVKANDVFFALHAVVLTAVTIAQSFYYESGDQRVSTLARIILAAMWLFMLTSIIPAGLNKIDWLEYITWLSYVKLAVTLVKYVPQAFLNYKRKSTVGWSIGNIILDFTGGSLSMVQMFLIAYNSDDWGSLFGDPTKFGLGFFSVLFDVVFMIQHYCLYTAARKKTHYNVLDEGRPLVQEEA